MEYDYGKIGFKAGLEIHQQLDTGKLFSHTPSLLRSDEPDYKITRKLHAIAGESGEVDVAVKHEAGLDKEFVYEGYNDTISLVELDEAPPEMINQEALKIALQIALLLNCEILPVTQIMRKTVIDGSNTSGFQRTVLIARNGYINTTKGKVRIESLVLEEDAARIIKRTESKVIYRLDRLGIPLIEIATAPDLISPEAVKEAALQIGDILRACKVKRGIGTIRQDVNISIKNHPRVEIKGFQDVKMFVKTIGLEIKRQMKNSVPKSEVRKAEPDGETSFLRPMPGSARMYPETDLPLLTISRDLINEVKSSLPKLRSDVKAELKKQGLDEELVSLVVKEGKLNEFKELLNFTNDANLIAKMLVLWPKDFAKKLSSDISAILDKLTLDVFSKVLEALAKSKISKHDVQDVLFNIASGKTVKAALKIEKLDLNEVEEFVIKLMKSKPGLNINAYMGMVMKEFKGKISGKEVMDILKNYVK